MFRRIEFNDNHLGNLKLNFLKKDNTPYKRIVFAGNNGSGKTTILEIISQYMNNGSISRFNIFEYSIGNDIYVSKTNDDRKYATLFKNGDLITGSVYYPSHGKKENIVYLNDCGNVYSRAKSGFPMNSVSNVGNSDLDKMKKNNDPDDYTDILQLFIDINSLDKNDYYAFSLEHKEKTGEEIAKMFDDVSRLKRFKDAYNKFFDSMRFDNIDNTDASLFNITFLKNNRKIPINDLSTGEKQIVCRGARILKNLKVLNDSIILIDEPELSMHPSWQKKIYNFYCNLFSGKGLNEQIFIATHSEYVIESALSDPDCLVILLNDNTGVVNARNVSGPFILDSLTSSEINYEAFGLYSVDYHIALYAKYQNKTGNLSIQKTDKLISNEPNYNPSLHERISSYIDRNGSSHNFKTLPTLIRNCIDHPNNGYSFSSDDLKTSIEFLRSICK